MSDKPIRINPRWIHVPDEETAEKARGMFPDAEVYVTTCKEREMVKLHYYRLSPELADGHRHSIVDTPAAAMEMIQEWFANCHDEEGATFSVEVVRMNREEFDALEQL